LASIQSTDSQEEKSYFFKKRILIVDDDSDITLSLKLGLEQHGFRVSTYNDPALALSEFKVGLYDLLLADIRMPGMSGLELYEKIKQIDDRIEVCFITAFDEYYGQLGKAFPKLDLQRCYLLKPITISDLVEKIKTILNIA
jgi:two-component system, OmpR family, response regulator ChvI